METSGEVPVDSSSKPVRVDDGISEFVVDSVSSVEAVSDPPPLVVVDKGSLDDILLRDHLIHTMTLVGTELLNTNQLPQFDPFAKFFAVPRVAAALRNYTYWRSGLRVRIVCTPPGSCLGGAVVSAICEGGIFDSTDTWHLDNENRDTMFTAVNDVFRIINFEQANSVEFTLPWVYFTDFAPTQYAFPTNMWRLQLQSLVPLQSTISTSASATVKIYAAFTPDYILTVPSYQMAPPKKGNIVERAREGVKSKLGGNTISGLSSTISKGATTLAATVPALAPFAAPIAMGAATVSSIASFFGFTREADVTPVEKYIPRLIGNAASVDGIDSGNKFTLMQGSSLGIGPGIGDGESGDPMCFEAIRTRWGIVSTFTLSTASPSGTVLHALPVTPFYAGIKLGNIFLSPGGYYGLPARYWRGGMEYMIYIPSSSNMRGMLQIVYQPTGSDALGPYAMSDPTGYQHTVALDLSSTQQHFISVPYVKHRPYQKRQVMADGCTERDVENCANGVLQFYLTTPWVAPRSGLITTSVIILARPASDMVYADPAYGTGPGNMMTFAYQSEPVDDTVPLFATSMLSESAEDFKLDLKCTTEVFPSARALVQKPCTVAQHITTSSAYFMPFYPNAPTNLYTGYNCHSSDDANTVSRFTWLSFYSMLFVGIRGSVRYKIVPSNQVTTPTLSTIATYTPFAITYETGEESAAASMGTDGMNHLDTLPFSSHMAVESQFPYVSERLYQNPRALKSWSYDGVYSQFNFRTVGFRQVGTYSDPSFANRVQEGNVVLCSAGDDFSVTRFRRVPSLRGVDWIFPNV